jgi:hypothetical protein
MSRDLNALREAFNNLVREQNTLGFGESSGLRANFKWLETPSSASSTTTCPGFPKQTPTN